jgi:hypothetical protein
MCDLMADPKNGWLKVSGDVAQNHANEGALVVAAQKKEGHGHVCVVIPGLLKESGSWGKMAPIVMNVGKDVFIGLKASFSFQTEPDYFLLTSTETPDA